MNYHCETFIYETQKSYLTLHVYLIPSEKKMIEVSDIKMNSETPASEVSVLYGRREKCVTFIFL